VENLVSYFDGQFVRGGRRETSREFHLILCPQPELAPAAPSLSLYERLLDRWLKSRPQRVLAEWVTGEPSGC
jgi:hypothetical protein